MSDDENITRKRKNRSLQEALQFFNALTPGYICRASVNLHLSIEKIVEQATSHGLNPVQIDELSAVILSKNNKLSQAARTKLVKCLIPSSTVPQSAVVRAVLTISSKVFASPGPSSLHSVLLRWMLLVYDRLDGFDQLHKLYNIIFTFVQSALLLPHACHLLFLLTRKHDVQFYKVQQLVALTNKLGPEPSIMGLLLIYKVYCPHLVTWRLNYSRKVFFKAHDAAWRLNILDVASIHEEDSTDPNVREEITSRKEKERSVPKSKQQKLIVPEVHTAAMEVQEDTFNGLSDGNSSVPYTHIDSFNNFLDKLDEIEYPSQIAAALSSERLQLLMTCDPDPVVMTRLSLWLQHVLSFGFRVKSKNETETFEKLLRMLLTFSTTVKSLPVVEGFLSTFLSTWDGLSSAPLILSLLACITPATYEDLYDGILRHLHRLFFSSDIYFKVMCLNALTKILGNQIRAFAQEQRTHMKAGGDSSSSTQEETGGSKGDPHALEIISSFVRFLDGLAVVGLRAEEDHYLMQVATLDFLQVSCQMYQRHSLPMVCLPMQCIYRLLLSDCPVTLARICSIITMLRESIQVNTELTIMVTTKLGEGENSRRIFNGLLLDTLGMLWQGRLFQSKNEKFPTMFDVSLPKKVKVNIPENSFQIYNGKAFLGLAYKFLKETQPEGKKVHPTQIKTVKDQYLQFLERENFPEFKKLVEMNMKQSKNKSGLS